MNKIKIIAKQFAISLLVLFSFCNTSIAEVHNSNYSARVSKSELQKRLEKIQSRVSLRYTPEVHEIVDTYIRSYRIGSERLLGRTNVFFPIFDLELTKHVDLPDEIKHLAIIESSLDVQAVSRSGAVGLWQFMKETAKLHGLSVNSSVDERKDPYLSTKAAYEYLRNLHEEFGDWTLALAAYNCGPGNVRKAIRKSQSKNFWKLEKFLPKETRRYIPKFIAASYLMNYYDFHSLKPVLESPKFAKTAIAKIYDYTTFKNISLATGVKVSTIKELNPSFNGNYIPKSTKGYLLTLPEKEMFQYLSNNGLINNLEFTLSNPMESFEKTIIFTGFQLRKAELELLNRMPALVSVVKNPIQEKVAERIEILEKHKPGNEEVFEYEELQPGESLMDLVGRHSNTTLEELITLNNLDLNDPPKPGDRIRIKNKKKRQ